MFRKIAGWREQEARDVTPVAPARSAERGQVLVIVAVGMLAIVAMVGLVIDGGYAWVRQRDTQNGADAVAKAGTVVVQHYLADRDNPWPTPNDYAVACEVAQTAASNGVALVSAEYVGFEGQPLLPSPVPVGACTVDLGIGIPNDAQGVKAVTSETFDTFLMQVMGFAQLTTTADATAVVGIPSAVPGGALPVTFPITSTTCDSRNTLFTIQDNNDEFQNPPVWDLYEIIDEEYADDTNLAIIPLCDVSPGSVGWLDWQCGQNLEQSVSDPCDVFIPIPAWVHTQTGNVNSLQAELNAYTGATVGMAEPDDSVLSLPIHDFTCDQDIPIPTPPAPDDSKSDCPSYPIWSGDGDNNYYHVPWWVGFKLDAAYVQGGDLECQTGPGKPLLVAPEPPGKVGCLKGWFVDRYDEPGPIYLALISPGDEVRMAVLLIE
jgi:hypothetical protein